MTPKETAQQLLDQIQQIPKTIKQHKDMVLRLEQETETLLQCMAGLGPTEQLVEDLKINRQKRREYKNAISELEVLQKLFAQEIHLQTKLLKAIEDIDSREKYAKGEKRSYVMRRLPKLANKVPNGKENPHS